MQQSPEYAFDCIPKVSDFSDPRNNLSASLYLSIIGLGLIGICQIVYYEYNYNINNKDNEDKTDHNNTIIMKRSSSILHSSIWLLVPFLPASGVVFKLGTLLAERLLYGASIGYCILQALLIYWVVYWLIRFVKGYDIIRNILFSSCVAVVIFLYSERTKKYSKSWKDNEVLFLDSILVCPNSAKLNLSVGKVYLKRNELATAEEFLEAAKDIDPDYCDVDYEVSYITLKKYIFLLFSWQDLKHLITTLLVLLIWP